MKKINSSKLLLEDVDAFCSPLSEITSINVFIDSKNTNKFNPDGLFSEKIFGYKGSREWREKFACIKLNNKIISPSVYDIFIRLNRNIKKIVEETAGFRIDETTKLLQLTDVNESAPYYGIYDFIANYDKMVLTENINEDRKELIEFLNKNRDKLFISYIPVIPPKFRPVNIMKLTNEISLDQINEFYLDIIRQVNNTPINMLSFQSIIRSNYISKIQMSVLALYEFVKSKLGKKHGYFRSAILGKRVDHSARGIIVGDPELPPYKVTLPFKMVLGLYEPFILHEMLSYKADFSEVLNKLYPGEEFIIQSRKLLTDIKKNYIQDKELIERIKKITSIAVKGKVVTMKRDPALHRGSWRAFYFDINDDEVIHINNESTEGFNADFDGDQMAVYALLTKESQEQAIEKLMPYYSHQTLNKPEITLKKDIFLGLYIMTKPYKLNVRYKGDLTPIDLLKKIDNYVIYRNVKMSAGMFLFNSTIKDYIDKYGLVTEPQNKKSFNKLYDNLNKFYQKEIFDILAKLQKYAYIAITLYPKTIALDDLLITSSPNILSLKKKFKESNSTEEKTKILEKIKIELIKELKKNNSQIYDTIQSGASGKINQISQMIGVKGLVGDITGKKVVSIDESFSDGLKPTEYFTAANGARKGLADRSLNTASTGYLTRKLVYALSTVILDEEKEDCGTTRTFDIDNNPKYYDRVIGRYTVENNRLILITKNNVDKFKKLHLRSPIYCRSPHICKVCYGTLYNQLRTPHIGVLAGSTIGERGTQLIMRTFHTGGTVSVKTVDLIKDVFRNQSELNIDEIESLFKQDANKLISLFDGEITFDIEELDKKLIDFTEAGDIVIPNILMKFMYNEKETVLESDHIITILADNIIERNSKFIKIKVSTNTQFAIISTSTSDFTSITKELISYLDRTEKVNNILFVFNRIFSKYENVSEMAFVHIEVLISNILRDSDNLNIPARLAKKWNPTKVGVKKVPFLSNWKNAMMFENIGKAIQNGLVSTERMDKNNTVELGSSFDSLLD